MFLAGPHFQGRNPSTPCRAFLDCPMKNPELPYISICIGNLRENSCNQEEHKALTGKDNGILKLLSPG